MEGDSVSFPGVPSTVLRAELSTIRDALSDGAVPDDNMGALVSASADKWRTTFLNNNLPIYGSISCDQNGEYSLNTGIVMAEEGEAAVYIKGPQKGHVFFDFNNVLIESVKIDKDLADTLSQLEMGNIVNIISSSHSGSDRQGNGHGNKVAVRVDGADGGGSAGVRLENSNIQGFFVGLQAERSGKITMMKGGIKDTYVGAVASQGGQIFLRSVDIDASKIGLFSSSLSVIGMNEGSLTVVRGGIGVISETGELFN